MSKLPTTGVKIEIDASPRYEDWKNSPIVTVELYGETLEFVKRLAYERNRDKRTNNTYNPTDNTSKTHYMGAKAEAAVCAYYGSEMDTKIYGAEGDNHQPDTYIAGLGVEVKAARFKRLGALKFDTLEEINSDMLILVAISDREDNGDSALAHITGVVTAKRFKENYYMKDWNHGPKFSMYDKDMSSPVKFKEWAEKRSKQIGAVAQLGRGN